MDTWRRDFAQNVPGNTAVLADALENVDTPFDAIKTADQNVQFAADPSLGLTRERYGWYSNGSQFDNTHFDDSGGEIQMTTSATGSDTARLRSAFAGQYTSQGLANPGVQFRIVETSVDSNGLASTDNGRVFAGAFWWDEANDEVETGFGVDINTDRAAAFWRSANADKVSPVSQQNWNIDTLDGSGDEYNPSGIQWDPSEGWIFNGPYWYYDVGKILLAFVDPDKDRLIPFHKFVPREDAPGAPNFDTPNLPTQVRVDNDGDASQLEVGVGGMQYTTYGVVGVPEVRETTVGRTGVSVTTGETSDPIDPTTTPGDFVIAFRRESGVRDVEVGNSPPIIDTDQDILLYVWSEFDDANGLTDANFVDPNVPNADNETRIKVDTNSTAFNPSQATFEGATKIEGGGGAADTTVRATEIERRLELNGTRVFTALDTGNNANVDFILPIQEGF